ncbi:MAG: Ribulose-phosphate 3-epimerase [Candidatus Amesbacteria bacterium GW2011_GWA2_47_11b]|uniref:Ribulose-phosphate 3-epimerase n=2 Tax=Candidatus Amesiibacteriota TaxID=1752730 RepID=A0A0G1TRA5_9BACT|nr:MAG: Ribulose-phosphate 3-epimerase [Candidatus Amesbacteria bacterium GW2011_GWA2_47_11b]KKU83015.1 MAG: Ribulose-phosphate 3-epimerase [Candidatus Amesbacteria bacterium GW2011_GWC2_47_8]
MEIIPAILTSDPLELEVLLRRIRDSKKYSRVQVDFVDGEYADNKSITPLRMKLGWGQGLKFDAHLMVVQKNLDDYVKNLFGFDRVIVQMESVSRPEDFDCLALDVHSPVAAIEPYLPSLKLVNLMAIEPGRGGQEFSDEVMEKVKKLRRYEYSLCVDGGVEQEHLPVLEKMGVDEVAVGAKRVLEWI